MNRNDVKKVLAARVEAGEIAGGEADFLADLWEVCNRHNASVTVDCTDRLTFGNADSPYGQADDIPYLERDVCAVESRDDFIKVLNERVLTGSIEQRHANFLMDVFDAANRHGVGLTDHVSWDSSEWKLVDYTSRLNEISDLAYLKVKRG